jgi:hypothetical protein
VQARVCGVRRIRSGFGPPWRPSHDRRERRRRRRAHDTRPQPQLRLVAPPLLGALPLEPTPHRHACSGRSTAWRRLHGGGRRLPLRPTAATRVRGAGAPTRGQRGPPRRREARLAARAHAQSHRAGTHPRTTGCHWQTGAARPPPAEAPTTPRPARRRSRARAAARRRARGGRGR